MSDRERWVYLGVYQSVKSSRLYIWQPVDINVSLDQLPELEVDIDNAHRFVKTLAKGRPGVIYEFDVEHTESGSFLVLGKNRDFVGFWPHIAQRIAWQARHDSLLSELAAQNKRNKKLAQNVMFTNLEPIREAYKTARKAQRVQLLALVIEYITRR